MSKTTVFSIYRSTIGVITFFIFSTRFFFWLHSLKNANIRLKTPDIQDNKLILNRIK